MDSVGLGPGISFESDDIKNFVLDSITQCDKPIVIDADALTIIASLGEKGIDSIKKRKLPTVLTPHPGEMARLLGKTTSEIQSDRLGSVRAATEKFNCVVLLKGDKTLIASPDGRLAINTTGNPGMSSGGMGDVLTGITATCLAQIPDPFHAVRIAAYIHGMAGDIARDEIGIAGFFADELAQKIPQALTKCLKDKIDWI
jgi:NAD(P)H-hydrate epimerase